MIGCNGSNQGGERGPGLAQYAAVAKEFGCAFFDAGAVAASSDIDGIHLEAEAHTAIGSAVAAQIRQLLKPG